MPSSSPDNVRLRTLLDHSDDEDNSDGSQATEVDGELDTAINRVLQIFPDSTATALAFHDLCDKLKKQPPDPSLEHQRGFVVMGPLLPLRQYLFASADSPSSISTDTDCASPTTEPEPDPIVQTGYFELSLSQRPLLPSLGWTLGRGRARLEHRGVDLVLASRDLRSMHAAFRFNEHGGLIMQALRDLELDGEILPQSQVRALARTKHNFSINDLRFRVERHHAPHLETYKQNKLREYLQDIGFDISILNPLVTATPSNKDEFVGNWKLHGITGQGGGEVTVDAATDTITGNVFAVKRLVRDRVRGRAHDAQIKKSNAVERMLRDSEESIHNGKNFLLRLHEVIYSGDSQPWQENVVDRVYMFTEPLCMGTFHQIFMKHLDDGATQKVKQMCFTQILCGLEFLHGHGWIHRDIKPTNLAVKSLNPPHALIIDFGATIDTAYHACAPEPGTCGTVGYLAPELENVKYLSEGLKAYDCAVDMFALGVVGQELFFAQHRPTALQILSGNSATVPRNPFREPVDSRRIDAMSLICTEMSRNDETNNDLRHVIADMLNICHEKRISAKEALAHQTFLANVTEMRDIKATSLTRKRGHE